MAFARLVSSWSSSLSGSNWGSSGSSPGLSSGLSSGFGSPPGVGSPLSRGAGREARGTRLDSMPGRVPARAELPVRRVVVDIRLVGVAKVLVRIYCYGSKRTR